MTSAASALLFPAAYRRRILALLLLNPGRPLHVREIARITGTTAGTLNRELSRLQAAGLLTRERIGNQLRYAADASHPIFPELSGLLRKTVGMADVLVDALLGLADRIDVAFVFGSMARGTEVGGSDVDVVVIGEVDFGAVIDALITAERTLARDVNPKVFSRNEWRARVRSKDDFALGVLAQPKIFLMRDERELAKLGRR